MRIKSVRIKNFRGFEDETILFDNHTCLVGPNGAGKSTVLCALNVFFQESQNATNVSHLVEEDFHNSNTDSPIEISVTFTDLSDAAKSDLDHYVRQNELVITAIAEYSPQSEKAKVEQFGERLIFKDFAEFFEAEKNKARVDDLRSIFEKITEGVDGFTSPSNSPTKAAMISALRSFEEANPELCTLERSGDQFFGTTKVRGKLEPYIQWIYLPAVKDASQEAEEASTTALGKLLQRTVRRKVNFEESLDQLRKSTREAYEELLTKEQEALSEISNSLGGRLAAFSHPGAKVTVQWSQNSEKSVVINEPRAEVKAHEGQFKGDLSRFGHGLQRSFLLAILQELASIEHDEATSDTEKKELPTLVFACEEPELYQHPPQAKHLANVLRQLSESGNQIFLTTHSPYFVSGETFEEIRLVRKVDVSGSSYTRSTTFENFAERIGKATGKKPDRPSVARAKLYAALRPEAAELYFGKCLVLVEGIEDRAYITTAIHLEERWEEARAAGLHIIPADKKSNILQLLTIAQEFEIPAFVIFDADGETKKDEHKSKHEKDNLALLKALSAPETAFPKEIMRGTNYTVWPNTLGDTITSDVENWNEYFNQAKNEIDPSAAGLKKNPVLIGETLYRAWEAGKKPESLMHLVDDILKFGSGDTTSESA